MVRVIAYAAACCVLTVAVAALAEESGQTRKSKYTWRKTDTSVALLNDGKVVWRHVHDRNVGKPYMRVGLQDGTELTRPWPIPKDYAKSDHVWHKALWWSWKGINGINFWEEHQTGTDPVKVVPTLRPDGSARIEMTVSYHLPDKPPLLSEQRVIDVSAPDKTGGYLIIWRAAFTPSGKEDVVLNRNGYGGFAIRMAGEFCGDKDKGVPAWTFLKNPTPDGKAAPGSRWMAYTGVAQNGRPACIAMFDHPGNPRYPTRWATRNRYPYMNPAFTASREDYTLAAGKTLTLTYGVLIRDAAADAKALEKAWKSFVVAVSAGDGTGDSRPR